ncbi:DUF1501 domain-containing protein [Derxia lacustris]|uniref:DUF1501 domain-containing protein n=1 Tax=Derxia lacustris TaxID=764842 RepID=UPI000A17736E|nr:DUF1501 domain-containing protein [Derxia lacustris]
MDRRSFLRAGSLAGVSRAAIAAGLPGAARLAALGGGVLALPAAQAASGYRALVAVMLYGGNDGLNTVLPLDGRLGQYQAVRGALALGTAADSERALGPIASVGGGAWGLHPRLEALAPFFDDGSLGFVSNVGPLARPTTRADYASWRKLNDADKLPEALFSHSDQQKLWQNGTARTETGSIGATGWGARGASKLSAGLYSFSGNSRFGTGSNGSALILPGPGTDMRGALSAYQPTSNWAPTRKISDALVTMLAAPNADPLFTTLAGLRGSAFDAMQRLGDIVLATPASATAAYSVIDSAFTAARRTSAGATASAYSQALGKQLYQVAKMIASHATVGGSQHIYFVQLGGFDTHGGQAAIHAGLMSQLGIGLAAFATAMRGLGLHDSVTSFTLSDFGRTFKPNSSGGTDHAWGNQQLVLGGAVQGGKGYGSYPELTLGGPDDAGIDSWEFQGRWIPTTSVDQYGATLLRWLGVAEADLDSVFPNLARFASRDVGFMKS